MHPTTFITFPP